MKQQHEQSGLQQQLSSPETTATLNSILAAVEAQNARLDRLTEQQKALVTFVESMDEELTRHIDRALTLQPSASTSPQIESVVNRLSEIESTLSEFVQCLDGKRLQSASQSLITEARKNHAVTVSVINGLKAQIELNQDLVIEAGRALQRIEERTDERVQKAVEQVAGEAAQVVTANLDASTERADQIIQATAKLESRQLWSAAATMCLTLLPAAVVVAGLWMSVTGLITGVQWALNVDGNVWLAIGRWLLVIAGLAMVAYGLFASVRWVAGLVETWKHEGVLKWRKR